LPAAADNNVLDKPPMADTIEIIAHRGASWDAPENTLAAVALAWEQGADAVEVDFRLTRDGQIVAIHDDSTLRQTGVDLRVSEHTLEELRQLDFGGAKAAQFRGERIATLAELLTTLPPGKRFYVEIKCGAEIVGPLAATLDAADVDEQRIVPICFSATVLTATRQVLPRSPNYLVVEFLRDPHSGVWYPDAEEMLAEAVAAELTGMDLMAARVDFQLAEAVRKAGLDLGVWTVDTLDEARRLIDLGVRRITTNRPAWLREQLR
jgi:glycerophosphoryl diester phosphodiesterase